MRYIMNIIDVNQENVDLTGFFCNMSKKKSEGYQRKLRWLKSRFAEGMKIKLLDLPITRLPGFHRIYAWRVCLESGERQRVHAHPLSLGRRKK